MFRFYKRAAVCAGLVVAALLTGCATPAPNYSPSVDNVEALKKAGSGAQAKVGAIAVTQGATGADAISLRGSRLTSSVGSNFGEYLAAALKQELELAKMYNPQSNVVITGTLMKNDIDASGFNTMEGVMEARFVVTSGTQVRFDKVKRVDRQWPSSFLGPVAIPAAINNYPVLVQSMVTTLVSDPDFVKALKN